MKFFARLNGGLVSYKGMSEEVVAAYEKLVTDSPLK